MPKRVLTSDLYALDLTSLEWEKLWPPRGYEDRIKRSEASAHEVVEELDKSFESPSHQMRGPDPRYFHVSLLFRFRYKLDALLSLLIHMEIAYTFLEEWVISKVQLDHPRQLAPSLARLVKDLHDHRPPKLQKLPRHQRVLKLLKHLNPRKRQMNQRAMPIHSILRLGRSSNVYNTATNTWSFPNPAVMPHSAASASPSSTLPLPNPSLSCLVCSLLLDMHIYLALRIIVSSLLADKIWQVDIYKKLAS